MKLAKNSVVKKQFLIVFLSVIVMIGRVKAQIPSKDSAEIASVMQSVSEKIEAVLRTEKTVYDEMLSTLKKINAITDTVLLDEALSKYRSKYLTTYGAAVKKAGVDMYKIASGLQIKYPSI